MDDSSLSKLKPYYAYDLKVGMAILRMPWGYARNGSLALDARLHVTALIVSFPLPLFITLTASRSASDLSSCNTRHTDYLRIPITSHPSLFSLYFFLFSLRQRLL